MSDVPHHAIVYAATGAIATGVARALGHAGATVWLAGRDDRVHTLAATLATAGIDAHAHIVDATDAGAVSEHLDTVREAAGRIDSVFNGIGGPPAELQYPRAAAEMTVADLLTPIERIVGSQFLTAQQAARHMADQGHGAIVTLSATLSGMTAPHMAGITAACGAVESMTRALAGEFGPAGIRVNCVRGSAMPETRTIQHTSAEQAAILGQPMTFAPPPLGRPTTVADTAATATFLAMGAPGVTGQIFTVCGGQFVGQG